jgi:hypothetical protein
MLNYTTKTITLKGGLAVQNLALKQTNIYKDSSAQRDFVNFFPTGAFSWKFAANGYMRINYNGNTQSPSLNQIQPIANNTDPLNIYVGNPNLKPAFRHNINFGINNYKVLKNRGFYGYGSLDFTQNAFSSYNTVDSLGRRINQTVNVNGNYNYNAGLNFNRKIKLFKLDIGAGPKINGNRNVSFVNGLQNITQSYNLSMDFRVSKYVEKKFDIGFNYSPTFSHSQSSINKGAVTEYWMHTISNDFNYKFAKGWNFSSNIQAKFRQKLSANDINTNAVVWNASVEKRLFKKRDIAAILSVYDILNQNIGFNRNITSNFISENTYTTVQRFALISLRWKFAKNRKVNDED